MPEWLVVALLGLAGTGLLAAAAILGSVMTARANKRAAAVQVETAQATRDNAFIDQLQEELNRYRMATDVRLDRLEAENRGYRAFIGVQRDHMAAHGITLPPWPDGLPR